MGLKREHKDNLSHVEERQAENLFKLRGELGVKLGEAEDKVADLTSQIAALNNTIRVGNKHYPHTIRQGWPGGV